MTAASLLLIAGLALAAYGAYDLTHRLLAVRRQGRIATAQATEDDEEFWAYTAAHQAIRRKFDPEGAWNEATSLPDAYVSEVRALNLRHRAMLMRRNGWSEEDFRDDA